MKFRLIEHHKHMLGDRVRLEIYREAIRKVVKDGDIVVDIGTGSGSILNSVRCIQSKHRGSVQWQAGQCGRTHRTARRNRPRTLPVQLQRQLGQGDRWSGLLVNRERSSQYRLCRLGQEGHVAVQRVARWFTGPLANAGFLVCVPP